LIPLRDDNPTEITPFVNYLLIALNVGAWLLLQGGGEPQALRQSVMEMGTRACELTQTCEVVGLHWESVLTGMFLHGSWGHLLGNMLFLWVFGNNIEDSMGHLRYPVFYLLCGLAATAAQVVSGPESPLPMVGASGAVSGIMGAYILLYPKVRVRTWIPPIFFLRLPAVLFLGYWFLIQLSMGFVTLQEDSQQGGVAFWAHVGGFVAGLFLIKIFEKPGLTNAKRQGRKLSRQELAGLEW
jgi:membrane associated rhomboid family serine protease